MPRREASFSACAGLLDAIPQPLWLRDADGALVWANQAYLRAVEATDVAGRDGPAASSCSTAPIRDEAARRRGRGGAFAAAGRRRRRRRAGACSTSPRARPPDGSAGIAIDVSELEARAHRPAAPDGGACAHPRPAADRGRDLRRRASASSSTTPPIAALGPRPGVPRLRARPTARSSIACAPPASCPSRRISAPGRPACSRPTAPSSRSETWWHLPDRRTLRVVTNPNPQGGVTYLFDDVSERVQLESQVQRADPRPGRDPRHPQGGRRGVRHRRPAQALQPRLRRHVAAAAQTLAGQLRISIASSAPAACSRRRTSPGSRSAARWPGLPDMRMGMACRIERRDGSVLDCAAQPLPDGATLLTFVDVTASVNVERALTERNEALERASRLRDDFVHHVSYELRSPLTNVIGFTQLLGDETVGPLNPRQREYADHIMRSSAALLAIINDILDLASIDTGSLELRPRDGRHPRRPSTRRRGHRGPARRGRRSRLDIDAPDGHRQLRGGRQARPPDPVQPAVERGRLLARRARRITRHGPQDATTRSSSRCRTRAAACRPRCSDAGLRALREPHARHAPSRRRPRPLDRALLRRAAWRPDRADLAPGPGTTVTCIFPANG